LKQPKLPIPVLTDMFGECILIVESDTTVTIATASCETLWTSFPNTKAYFLAFFYIKILKKDGTLNLLYG
jgi:hypothetical protein